MANESNFLDKPAAEKIRILLTALESGEPREELAARLGYQSVKSLDSFLRRQDYVWDRHNRRYVAKPTPPEPSATLPVQPPERVGQVLALLKEPGMDIRTVAKRAGFSDHREMAKYMAAHHYTWSAEANTYVGAPQNVPTATRMAPMPTLPSPHPEFPFGEGADLTDYEPLLNWLASRQDALHSLLSLSNDPQFLPRYLVPGVLVTKSIHISHLLAQLARDYSQEKHVSQREIFEVALIEFFQRHGYHDKIMQLFN